MPAVWYHTSLQPPTAITTAVSGAFSAPRAQEIAAGRGRFLDLLKPDEHGHLVTVHSEDVFGNIRSLTPFRLTGSTKDHLLVGSDSGRIVVLEFDADGNTWKKLQQETYGKSGCRRIVPGQYLASDPRGRAVMIAAVEKQKFVYILNRDSATNTLTISSPLEAHKSHSIVYSICGIDVGFDNPVFAALEVDYGDLDEDPDAEDPPKQLVYYELDLGLNHVLRKWNTVVESTSNLLIPVPGSTDGPGGVLVCSENYITYKHNSSSHSGEDGQPDVNAAIPRRQDMLTDPGLLVVCFATHKQKDMFFFLVQSEYGDLYKVSLDYTGERVRKVNIKYFDTIPVCNSIVVLRAGFLFGAAEFGNHKLYQFQGIGDDTDDAIIGYMSIGEEGTAEADLEVLPLIRPRPLKNLLLIDDVESMSPITDCIVADLVGEDTPQVYTLCGRGPQSSMRVLRHGLAVSELAVSDLPGVPNAVWTVKKSLSDALDQYIVVSFINATLVLSIGETVEEVADSGFLGSTPTLLCATLQDDSTLQVHPHGMRHVRRDSRINEWKPSSRRNITKAACNPKQVVVAQGSDVVYFELDSSGGLTDVTKLDMQQDVLCLDVGPIPEGRTKSKFLAIGFPDKTVWIYSLESELAIMSRLICPVPPQSVMLLNMPSETGEVHDNTYLFVGLSNGFLQRCTVDQLSGQISDPRLRLCGVRPCKLVKVRAQGSPAVLVLSSRSWLCFSIHHKFTIMPLGQDSFEHCSDFASEPCPEGLVAVTGHQVRILALERVGKAMFNQNFINLKCTPRKFIRHPTHPYLIVLETDHRTHTSQEKEDIKKELKENAVDEMEHDEDEDLPERDYGTIKAPAGTWASYIRITCPKEQTTLDMIELEDNQAAISLCTCHFTVTGKEEYLIVGTVKDLTPCPKSSKGGALLTFRFTDSGTKLELVHKTPLGGIPHALCPYNGKVLCGVDNLLRLYDLGKRKLLRKCETRYLPNTITEIQTRGERIYVSDSMESMFFLKYKASDNQLAIFADNTTPRWMSCSCVLDYHTVVGADRWGNIFVSRLPEDTNDDVDGDTMWERSFLNGAPTKAEEIIRYHVGELVTSLQKTTLTPGGQEVVLYTTIMGSIGAFVPLQTRDDADFFLMLEMHMRQEHPPLCGREHMAYRSAHVPLKDVLDGDFVERYTMMPYAKQKEIAEELERQPEDVCKRLEDMRHRIV